MSVTQCLRAVLTVSFLVMTMVSAHAESLLQLFPADAAGCTQQVKINLGEALRAGIENEVKRGDDALKAPQPISSLGCLDQLMNVNLDIAIPIPDLKGIFASAVSQAEGQLCQFAKGKLDELTAQLSGLLQFDQFNFLAQGGLTGSSASDLGSVEIQIGGTQSGATINANGTTLTPNNIDAVYDYIYGNRATNQ